MSLLRFLVLYLHRQNHHQQNIAKLGELITSTIVAIF